MESATQHWLEGIASERQGCLRQHEILVEHMQEVQVCKNRQELDHKGPFISRTATWI